MTALITTAFGQASSGGGSNSNLGLFVGGNPGTGILNTIDKYLFSSDVIEVGTVLSVPRQTTHGHGDTIAARISGGTSDGFTTDKYTYATDAVTAGGSLTEFRSSGAACSNSTKGYVAGGQASDKSSAELYTYATDTFAALGPKLSQAKTSLGAACNGTFGIFGGGVASPGGGPNDTVQDTDRVTFATDVFAASTVLTVERGFVRAEGNTTIALFAAGVDNSVSFTRIATTDKYTYATTSVSVGTTLVSPRQQHGAVGNKDVGIFGGGFTTVTTANTEKYTYAGDTVSPATSLTVARGSLGGGCTSDSHGGL